jgi:hypothetical protein
MLNKNQVEAIAKHLRELAQIFESSIKGSTVNTILGVDEIVGSKRGRKPGAVSDDVRCENVNGKQQRCKNRATQGKVCGKHLAQAGG